MSEKNRCTVCGETLELNGLNKAVLDIMTQLGGVNVPLHDHGSGENQGGQVDHEDLNNIGTWTHSAIDDHVNDSDIHFEQTEIDHENLLNKGVKTHAEIDTHVNSVNNPHSTTINQVCQKFYYCTTETDVNNALTAIGTDEGTIIISGTIILTATINISSGGFGIIHGNGNKTVIDCNGDRSAFNITSGSWVLRDFKIDAADITTAEREIINVDEAADNKIVIDNVNVYGEANKKGYGIELNSKNCVVRNCYIYQVNYGISLGAEGNTIIGNNCNSNTIGIYSFNLANDNTIIGNTCNSNNYGIDINNSNNTIIGNTCNSNNYGIVIFGNADYNTITGNICKFNTVYGIYLNDGNKNTVIGNTCNSNNFNSPENGGGIWIVTSDYNTINGNMCYGNANAGDGTGYGIFIVNTNCNDNTVMGNTCLGNDTNFQDNGTNTHKQTAAGDLYNNIS